MVAHPSNTWKNVGMSTHCPVGLFEIFKFILKGNVTHVHNSWFAILKFKRCANWKFSPKVKTNLFTSKTWSELTGGHLWSLYIPSSVTCHRFLCRSINVYAYKVLPQTPLGILSYILEIHRVIFLKSGKFWILKYVCSRVLDKGLCICHTITNRKSLPLAMERRQP